MKTSWQDPLSGEIISPDIAGLQEAVGKIEDVLDMNVVSATDVPLTEIFISENDRYRIYQAAGKRNWVSNPAPVIKVNGTPVSSGFTINYGGGAVIFEPPLTVADVVTADFSYVSGASNTLDTHLAGYVSVSEFGIISDGVTDQTTVLVDLLTTGALKGYRGNVRIPYNTKFDIEAVLAVIPLGMTIIDESKINYHYTDTYKNNYITYASGDRTDDDTVYVFSSNHHPAIILNNMGTAVEEDGTTPTPSALSRLASILFGYGIDATKNILSNFLVQVRETINHWSFNLRLLRKYGDDTTIYDSTVFQILEEGQTGIGGNAIENTALRVVQGLKDTTETILRVENTKNSSSASLQLICRDSLGNARYKKIKLTDLKLAIRNTADTANIWEIDDTGNVYGTRLGSATAADGDTTPSVKNISLLILSNSAPTSITNFDDSTGNQEITLFFTNNNTTIKQGSGISLKGATDFVGATGNVLKLIKIPAISAQWKEVSRNT